MPINSVYYDGSQCRIYSGETSATLPSTTVSEPFYIRNAGPDILTLTPLSGQTVEGVSSMQMAINDSFLMVPQEKNWVAVLKSADKLTTNKIGFTAGSGGSVTQTGTINSSVTLNKPCGKITLVQHDFSNNDIQEFTLNNSYIELNDVVIVSFRDGNAKLYNQVVITENGSCNITVGDAHNQSTGSISVVINFAIIKGDS
jgi:hypothetical protein